MEEVNISKESISWKNSKIRFGQKIIYNNKILKHKDHISISKTMYVNGMIKHFSLVHIPLSLISEIDKIEAV